MSTRCEGWRRHGGAFTLGPVRWEQCEKDAAVKLEVEQDSVKQLVSVCLTCWREGRMRGIKILSAEPLNAPPAAPSGTTQGE